MGVRERNKTDKEKIKELLNTIESIYQDIQKRYAKDYACDFCEYGDCTYRGDECPGFERDDCFVLKEEFKNKYLGTNDSTGVK